MNILKYFFYLITIWGWGYTFHLFPWEQHFEWWYLPHIMTIALFYTAIAFYEAEKP